MPQTGVGWVGLERGEVVQLCAVGWGLGLTLPPYGPPRLVTGGHVLLPAVFLLARAVQ